MNIQTSNPRSCREAQEARTALEWEKMSLGALGQELASEKIKNIQKDLLISSFGQQVALLKNGDGFSN